MANQRKVKWGVLGAANIALKKVIPAMQQSEWSEVTGIASRDLKKAQEAARSLGIAKAYGSYEELLADPEIEAIYNPLPNHLHVPWSIKAAEAKTLLAAQERAGVKMGEAFMVRTHPQWLRARELVQSGKIGELKAISGAFSYFNRDPANVRNMADIGGGAMMDIGCYPITTTRFMFGEEPKRVVGLIEQDPDFKTDRLAAAIMDFPSGPATFTCSTQMVHYQRMQIFGTKGRIEIEIPFNAPLDKETRIFIDDGRDVHGSGIVTETIPLTNQYTIQGDVFSRAVLGLGDVPVSIEDGIANMAVIAR